MITVEGIMLAIITLVNFIICVILYQFFCKIV